MGNENSRSGAWRSGRTRNRQNRPRATFVNTRARDCSHSGFVPVSRYAWVVQDLTLMSATEQIEIRRLASTDLEEHLDALASVLADCVAGGASVSYLAPFSQADARAEFVEFAAEVEQGRRLLLAAFAGGALVGTVQVILALPPNQPHRAEIAKLLVHRSARRRGIAQLLMEHAEAEARAEGKTLLVLDTVTGDSAERLYERLRWTRVGVIPGYALYPDRRPCDTTVFWKTL